MMSDLQEIVQWSTGEPFFYVSVADAKRLVAEIKRLRRHLAWTLEIMDSCGIVRGALSPGSQRIINAAQKAAGGDDE